MYKMIPEKLLYYSLYFFVMAFAGWIIEVVYRSLREKRFVNAGFLSGPFVPIYGFGSVIITVISVEARSLPPVIAWSITLLSPTILEYFGSWFMERIFGLKLWDYHDRHFNLNGRIALRFSVYWAFLAALLLLFVQPLVFTRITVLGPYLSHFVAGGFFAYLILDINNSVRSIYNFKTFQNDIALLIEKGKQFHSVFDFSGDSGRKKLNPVEIRRILKPLNAFPNLRSNFKGKLPAFPDWIRTHLEKRFWKQR
jgi:uncharacterized membrane protein